MPQHATSAVEACVLLSVVFIALWLLNHCGASLVMVRVGLSWCILTIVPYSFYWGSMSSDRRLYLALMGVGIAATGLLDAAWERVSTLRAEYAITLVGSSCVILVLCSVATDKRTKLWCTPRDLWASAAALSPSNPRARLNLALEERKLGNLGAAKEQVRYALDLHPRYPEALNLAGSIEFGEGDVESAEMLFKRAASAQRRCYAEPVNNLGVVSYKRGDYEKAANYFECALLCESAMSPQIRGNLSMAAKRLQALQTE